MSLNQYIQRIDRYLSKDEGLPIIVDVQNETDLEEFIEHYAVGDNQIISASKYCAPDEMPRYEDLFNDIATKDGVMIVTDVTSFLKLDGEGELRRFLRQVLSLSTVGKVIFITFQCRRYLPLQDQRITRRIILVDGAEKAIPEIVFADPSIPLPRDLETIQGIENFPVVFKESAPTVYVMTEKSKEAFPYSLYNITSLQHAYEVLVLKDPTTRTLPETIGTKSQWLYAMKLFENKSNWTDVVDNEFGSHTMLEHVFPSYSTFSEEKKWLYLIAVKLFGARNNWCLTTAARKASGPNDFQRHVFRCILEKSVDDTDYWDCYDSRKSVLKQMGNPTSELTSYCKVAFSKGINTLCYLTDNTQKERETIFEFLDQYGLEMDRSNLMQTLSKVYPALYQYLLPYRFENTLLDQYFQDYKYQKVINKVLPAFEAQVEEQAEKREYNSILSPRSSLIESLNRKHAQLYFMDAMGVEYLGYILSVCRELNLIANVSVCAAELPSITSRNKEFLPLFEDAQRQTVSIKDIDDIKHHGKYDFDFYNNSKLPIHLIKELEVIRKVLEKIRNDLSEGELQRVFMIADHGASRLAVLHDTENIWEMAEKGQHSGRCCPKSDVDVRPDFAADAGDFWSLANYDRFKGGRKANVEVHGGATLEELCVPIIELTYMASMPEIGLMPVDNDNFTFGDTPLIEVSFRKKAALKIYSTVRLQNVSIVISGTVYHATELGNNYYRVDLPELKKEGTYHVDVLSGNNVIAENLSFIIKKEGQKERSIL